MVVATNNMAQIVHRPGSAGGSESSVRSSVSIMRYRSVPSYQSVKRAVELAIHRQIRALIRIFLGQFLIQVDAQPRRVPRIHHAVFECVVVRKHGFHLFGMGHVFLDAEVVNGRIEVQRRRHAHRR